MGDQRTSPPRRANWFLIVLAIIGAIWFFAREDGKPNNQPRSDREEKSEEEWTPVDAPAQKGTVQVRVTASKLGHVRAIDEYWESRNKDTFIAITIEIANVSDSRVVPLSGWCRSGSQLVDKFGNTYRSYHFPSEYVYWITDDGRRDIPASLYPGKKATDVLLFDAPVDRAEEIGLQLSAENIGSDGQFRIRIPMSSVKGGPKARPETSKP